MTRTFTFEEVLYQALDFARNRAEREKSREASLIVTKLEEAALWNDAWRQMAGLEPLGLNWRG